MIRSIVFDIGNVLLPFDFNLALERLEGYCDAPVAGLLPHIDLIKAGYEEGRIGRAEFVKKVVALLGYRGKEADLIAVWEDVFEENEPMTRLVQALHGSYPLYLLSNTNDIHIDFVVKRYAVFQWFTDAVYSYRVGCSKPGRAIFEMAARQFGIVPRETIFIDDLAPNVEAALAAGYQAIQYDFRNHGALLAHLEQWGVKPRMKVEG